jgi:hypothetical protein
MSPAETARTIRLRLLAELDGDRASLGRLAASIGELRATRPDAGAMRALAIAFQLERFYTAVEGVLTRVLRTLDGDVPTGPDWHSDLLRAASVPVEGLRPAIVPTEVVSELRELLGFRHFARHGYDTPPEVQRVEDLADVALRAHAVLDPAIAAFGASLRDHV